MKDHTLAILSGIGAAAGMHMANRLVEIAQEQGAKSDADFPDFVLYNLPSAATNEKGIVDSQLLLGELATAIKKFNVWGCDYLLMACNTIHQYLPEIKDRFGGAVINMVDLAARPASAAKTVGVICSVSSRESGIYRRALVSHNSEVEVIYPNDEEQGYVDRSIDAAIRGERPGKSWRFFHQLEQSLVSRGARRVIVGCTEIPLCLKGHPLPLSVIDAGELAVREALLLTSGARPD